MRMGALIAPALIVASGGLFTGAAVESLPKPQPSPPPWWPWNPSKADSWPPASW